MNEIRGMLFDSDLKIWHRHFLTLNHHHWCSPVLKNPDLSDKIAVKYLLSLLILMSLTGFGLGMLWQWPKSTYLEIVGKSQYNDLFSLKISGRDHLTPTHNAAQRLKALPVSRALWRKFIIGNYIVPLPIRHPELYFVPVITVTDPQLPAQLGVKIFRQNHQKVIELVFHHPQEFHRRLTSQKLYEVPLVFEHLKRKRPAEIWQDLFSLRLESPGQELQQMAYQLYLLEQRVRYFPQGMKNFYYLSDSERGVIELQNPAVNMQKHFIYHLNQGLIHHFSIEVLDNDPEFVEMRNLLAREVYYQEFSEELSRTIYHEFKALPYHRQISQEGMVYLFSAWSQNLNNRSFLREMIHYLERGKDNLPQLGPLYDYALSRYQTSLSGKDERLQENAEEKIRRKIAEERAEQRLLEASRPVDLDNERFPSDEDKMNFFLQRAKDQGIDSDKDELIVD